MPGSGKSSFGKKLANNLKYTFVDLDKLISINENESIESIFKTKGDAYFREMEHKYLLESTSYHQTVVSCGGGTPSFHNNMNIINNCGISVYLKANNLLLAVRIFN
jgi:shikimate kinase